MGEAVDIASCMSGPPLKVAGFVDPDIVMVGEGGVRLRFGACDVDRCAGRPETPSEVAFRRVD